MHKRLPEYLKRPLINTDTTKNVRHILKQHCLNTVCENARCPNKNECYTKNTATFLIMGTVCTRNCRFCNISGGKPEPLDRTEPYKVAQAIKELGHKLTSKEIETLDSMLGLCHETLLQEAQKTSESAQAKTA